MFLHLGNNVCAERDEIVGIFDLDNVTVSAKTREYINALEKSGRLVTVSPELPKSLVVTEGVSYISPISVRTLIKRAGRPF